MEITTLLNQIGGESATSKPKKCACKCRIIIAVVLAVLVIGVACWYVHRPMGPKPGTICTVQFRRGALGAGATIPVSPHTDIANGAEVSVSGTLIAVNREAILLEWESRNRITHENGIPTYQVHRLWIPKSSILLIRYDVKP